MALTGTHKAFYASSDPLRYDVFLSFRGVDTRKNFTDHLYNSLVTHGIHTFRDDEELEKGGDISVDLSRVIEESRIFIVIFSKNYAYSTWCLNELLKIIEAQKELMVVPIFYHVPPSDVRKQLGCFNDAFTFHEKDADQNKKEIVQKWRIALRKAANLSGWHVENQ